MTEVNPPDRIVASDMAHWKQWRYFDEMTNANALCSGTDYICRKTSPNHDRLYEENRFTIRGDV